MKKDFKVTVAETKIVEAETKEEAYDKAFKEFMKEGINPNSFYVYINGEEF